MDFSLGSAATHAGYRLASYDAIDSTNAEALRRATSGDPGDLWIVADRQTAGRGRRGRSWQTASGNLAATVLLITTVDAATAATLGFVAALALEEAVRTAVCLSSPGTAGAGSVPRAEPGKGGLGSDMADPHPLASRVGLSPMRRGEDLSSRLRLKWPNDVLLDSAKLAGILVEVQAIGDGRQALAIGIGVNTSHAPEGLPYPTASLAGAGYPVAAAALFTALSDSWVKHVAEWDKGFGFDAIRRRWLDHAAGLGKSMSVVQGARAAAGIFETIDGSGRLVLRADDGSLVQVTAGDVHFGAAATSGQ